MHWQVARTQDLGCYEKQVKLTHLMSVRLTTLWRVNISSMAVGSTAAASRVTAPGLNSTSAGGISSSVCSSGAKMGSLPFTL